MEPAERISLIAEDILEYARYLAFLSAFHGFHPRSEASDVMALSPDFTAELAMSMLDDFTAVHKVLRYNAVDALLRKEGLLLRAELSTGRVSFHLIAADFAADKALAAVVGRFLPHRFVGKEEEGVWAEFTYRDDSGCVTNQRQFLRCPTWGEISGNYPSATRSAVAGLLAQGSPWALGRLVIWHGSPGTGKTYAIRALLQEWRKRFDFVVVNDPENFAASPSYYYKIASRSSQFPIRYKAQISFINDDDEEEEDPSRVKRKRRLFLLEDCADLVMQESRTSHYDKLGKLLNMTDGLFGQGREDLFLLTFNEELTRIDPAFLRPGRCLAKVEFSRFDAREAGEWLRAREWRGTVPSAGMSIAEMYAAVGAGRDAGASSPAPRRQIGFSRGAM